MPQVGFIVKNLAYSVVSGNALHQGYMQRLNRPCGALNG